MSRRPAPLLLGLFALAAGCSNLLGLKQPSEEVDGGAHGDGAGDGQPVSDFTVQVAHAKNRVPAGSFDFISVVVSRGAGMAGPISVDIPQPPAGVTTAAATIAATATTGEIKVTGDTSLAIGATLSLDVVATGGGFTHDLHVDTVVTGIPGTLDPTFGGTNTGFLDVALGTIAGSFGGVAVDGSDSPVAAGTTENSIGHTGTVAFLHADGTLINTANSNPCSCSAGTSFNGLALASSGRAFAFGQGFDKAITTPADEPMVSAFDGGSAATAFDNTGAEFIVITEQSVSSLAVDSSNLVALSTDGQIFRFPVGGGRLDLTWNDGLPIPLTISAPGPQALAIDPAQHIYVAGQGSGSGSGSGSASGGGDAVLQSITEAGEVDTSFGSGGIADSGVPGTAVAAVVEADHGIVVAGIAGEAFLLFRVLPSGALDPAFGTAGVAQPALPFTPTALTGMVVQPDGKIVVAGNGSGKAILVRYLASGALDPTFGTGGAASIGAGQMPIMAGVALQSTGMIIITGGNADEPHSNGINGNGFVARVWF